MEPLPQCSVGMAYRPTDTPLIEGIVTSLNQSRTATVAVVRARVTFQNPVELIFIFAKKNNLLYACAARPSKGNTALTGARIFSPVYLNIPTASLLKTLSREVQAEFTDVLLKRSACRPSKQLWDELLSACYELNPNAKENLAKPIHHINQPPVTMTQPGGQSFHFQRDQLGTALDIAKMNRIEAFTEILTQTPDGRIAPSVIHTFTHDAHEVPTIFADYKKFPGYDKIHENTTHAAFVQDNRRLDVFVTHAQPIEKLIGSDLIYVNHHFGTVVLVQYKMFGSDDKFRNDGQAQDESKRLRDFRDECNLDPSHAKPITDYRLCPDPCFFKLMQRKEVDTRSDHLVPGQYFPLWLWDGLWNDDTTLGPKGGRVLKRIPSARHLCRTSFVGLVANGWIGTKLPDTIRLLEYIAARTKDGASIMTAISSERDDEDDPADFEFES